jgi:cell division protease FtsH
VPKGVLLVGPPGTGKTLLAKAVAGEANVPFFSISGSDFVEMFVGVGASRVRDLFEQAKKHSPSIIFIDEIDAVGRHRGAGLGGGHDEREQTLNQLLVEMDGFSDNEGIIIIAATNRRDILDPALLRPGRFDRQIVVNYPDIKGREDILKVHTRNKSLAPDVNLKTIAKTTAGFTGADLENLVNEAALLAARKNRKAIIEEDIKEATIKVIAGPEKKSKVVTEKEKRLTAFHEAGHAICTYYCETQDKVHQVSIIPRGMAGGYTMSLPEHDRSYRSKTQMQEEIIVLLGGRAAEKLVLDDISTGASNDIERATTIARNMVTRYGFSEKLGPIVYGHEAAEVFLGRDYSQGRNYSENVAAEIDGEIRELVESAYERAKEILSQNIDQLNLVANYLLKHEKIDGPDFEKLMKGELQLIEDETLKEDAIEVLEEGMDPKEAVENDVDDDTTE